MTAVEPVVFKVKWDTARYAALLARSPDIVMDEVTAALTEGSMLAEREIKERTPTSGAGTLRDSIGALPVTISGQAVSAGVATSLSYALPVETGSRPHWAPIEPLVDWVQRRFGKSGDEAQQIAEMIRFKIAKKGTKGAFMFRDGGAAVQPQILARLDRALERAAERIGGVQ